MDKLVHKGIKCYMYWREKPLGRGEASAIVIPLDDMAKDAIEENIAELRRMFSSTTESEENIDFTIEELDKEENDGNKIDPKL